jgi:hypothetical protein
LEVCEGRKGGRAYLPGRKAHELLLSVPIPEKVAQQTVVDRPRANGGVDDGRPLALGAEKH